MNMNPPRRTSPAQSPARGPRGGKGSGGGGGPRCKVVHSSLGLVIRGEFSEKRPKKRKEKKRASLRCVPVRIGVYGTEMRWCKGLEAQQVL